MDAQFKIEGLKELNKELKALPRDFRDKALNGATSAAARLIRDEAIELAPRDEGRLKAGIFSGVALKKDRYSQWVSQYRVDVRTRGKKAVPYAHMVEFGTGAHSARGARSFMRQGFDNKKEEAVRKFKTVLDKKVKFYQRKLNRMIKK